MYVIVTIVSVIVAIYAKQIVNFFVRQQGVITTETGAPTSHLKTTSDVADHRCVCIVLGSGGHTSEMLRILKAVSVE